MIYITTDTHFNHDKMIEYCGRPKNFEEMIKEDILKKVTIKDTLIHLGDVCIGKDIESNMWFSNLPCDTILIIGNHDKKSKKWYLEHGWNQVYDTYILENYLSNKILLSHTPQKDDGSFDINIHGHFHNQLERLKARRWVVAGEEERNKYDLSVLTEKHKLLSLEEVDYKCLTLNEFLKIN